MLNAHVLGGKKPESEYTCICMQAHMCECVDMDRLGCLKAVILLEHCFLYAPNSYF